MHPVSTPNAPAAGGHYSQAIVHAGLVYVAGQLPIVPGRAEHVVGSIEEQTEQVLRNIAAVLEAAGSSLSRTLQVQGAGDGGERSEALRLKGPPVIHTRGHDIISDGIPLGGIQVVGEGQPIILLVDRQSTGGYTKVATVCSFDIGRVGQVNPGKRLRFKAITVPESHTLLMQERKKLEGAIL